MKPRCGLYVYDQKYVWVFGGESTNAFDERFVVYMVLSLSTPGESGKSQSIPIETFEKEFYLVSDCADENGYEMPPMPKGGCRLVVNGQEVIFFAGEVTYQNARWLAGISESDKRLYSVVYTRGPGGKAGILSPGQRVPIVHGMVFNVAHTGGA